MARRRTHVIVGIPTGAVVAAYTARTQPGRKRFAETIGGGVGGYVGALLPDVLEPAISSWHRSIAHSWTTVGVGTAILPEQLRRWQDHCRVQSERHQKLREQTSDVRARVWHAACAIFWLLASGFLVGVVAGYASHLALDLLTPRGLPVLV